MKHFYCDLGGLFRRIGPKICLYLVSDVLLKIQATAGIPTKKIAIFLTMAPPEERPYAMNVITLATAKVQDLIGLICWQYGVEGRQPPLK